MFKWWGILNLPSEHTMIFRSPRYLLFALLIFACSFAQELVAQTYYVATNGVNTRTRAQAQNRNTPYRSIQTALNRAESGSTIVVLDGTYWGQFNFVRSNVTLRAERKEGAFIVGSIFANDLSFIRVDGFEVSNRRPDAPRSKGIAMNRCHNVVVRDCRVHDCRGGGIAIDQSDQILCEWNIVYRNAFWDPDQHSGISIYQPQRRTTDKPGYDVIVRNNTSFSNENRVNNVLFGRPTDGNGIVVDDTQNLTAPTGNNQLYSGTILVENNLCFNNGGQGVHCYQSENVTIRNNTLSRNMRSFDFGGEVSVVRGNNVLVYNNILSANDNRDAALKFEGGFVWFNFNLIHNGFTPGVNNGRNTIFSPPGFDPNGFFDLGANSPGVDAGLNQSGRFGLDVDGKFRSSGNGIDIGAKEFAF
jgi:parallel beta-helix repeat protein